MTPSLRTNSWVASVGGRRGRNHLLFEQTGQRRARGLGLLLQLHDLLIDLLVILSHSVTVTDGREVDGGVVRGDDGQGALEARMQGPPKPLADSVAQRG